MPDAPHTYSAEQAADYLGCSVSQISNLVRRGHLRAAQVGRGYRFRQSWLDQFLEEEADRQAAARAHAATRPNHRQPPPDLSRYDGGA